MSQPLPSVTDAEWAVMEILWEREPVSVRQLTDALYPGGGASEYATVHKLLERLKAKGYVRRAGKAGAILFSTLVGRDKILGQQLEALVDKMCGGSLPLLLSNLVRVKRLKPNELRDLLALVNELDAKQKADKERR